MLADTTANDLSEYATTHQQVQDLIHDHPLIIFSKSYCPHSKNAKALLDRFTLIQPYKVVEVDQRPDAALVKQALTEISDRGTFPNIFLNGTSLGGMSELQQLNDSGKLEEQLKAARQLKI
ncbi:thioredoxin-like protein [Hesseltinella vesiculosa]|uniref:Thioredoxin-like protein n=1 Tax=Hesseltinella vesiculosa TaxID=101127 RepID=A0A1X2GBP7_9FUNG|nr:thioredoxin-like protein [Hesseltinella vesiculosa]